MVSATEEVQWEFYRDLVSAKTDEQLVPELVEFYSEFLGDHGAKDLVGKALGRSERLEFRLWLRGLVHFIQQQIGS